ncbi:MAG: hypothetical protein JWP25_598 [Bradyrhizobium sp.]|jgi:hypothetical protein|nr:hypothetical protein [Bradyrhizobium sp.]MEA2868808.1 hypothetical protein [Bradyrhizobium sp.]
MRPRSDAATDGDRLGRLICDGGPDQTQVEPSPVLLRGSDIATYPQVGQVILRWPKLARTENENPSELLAVHDKSGALRDLVVKLHRGEICFVGLPVHAR